MAARPALVFLFVALLSALVSGQGDTSCALTSRYPKKARYLKFCQDYNAEACCIPGHDLENQVQFENLIDGLGPGCKNPMMYPELRYFYCLGCDPDQPKFTNNQTMEIAVCKSFVTQLWADPAYQECGVMYPNPCPSNWVNEGMDPYTCGDDLLLPKVRESWSDDITATWPQSVYDNWPANGGLYFMNTFLPPGLEDYTFVEVDDIADPSAPCWTAPAFQNSAARLASTTGLVVMFAGMALSYLL